MERTSIVWGGGGMRKGVCERERVRGEGGDIKRESERDNIK
jgi:hypothetical protein